MERAGGTGGSIARLLVNKPGNCFNDFEQRYWSESERRPLSRLSASAVPTLDRRCAGPVRTECRRCACNFSFKSLQMIFKKISCAVLIWKAGELLQIIAADQSNSE